MSDSTYEKSSYGGPSPLFYHVYILRCSDGSHYVGRTKNLSDRLKRHSKGHIKYTSGRRPIELITFLSFNNEWKSVQFEKYLKTGSGRAFMKKRLISQSWSLHLAVNWLVNSYHTWSWPGFNSASVKSMYGWYNISGCEEYMSCYSPNRDRCNQSLFNIDRLVKCIPLVLKTTSSNHII